MNKLKEFKILDIKSDCFDLIVASYAKWLKGEYRFLFSNSLGFGFNNSKSKVGEKIYVDMGDIIELANNNGIQVVFYKNIEDIGMVLNGGYPVVVELDEYYCYWRINYQKLHKKHYVILLEYYYDSGFFSCLDTMPTLTNLSLSNDFVLNNSQRLFSFLNNNNSICTIDLNNAFSHTISKFSREEIWNQYSMFVESMDNCSLRYELKGYEDVDVIHIPLIWNMKKISFSYNLFQSYLEYVKKDKLMHSINKLHTIKQNWDIATNILTISFVRNDFDFPKDKVKEYLRKAIYEIKGLIGQLSLIE